MNIGITSGYQSNIKQNPNFGMAVEMRGKAAKQVKKELAKLSERDVNNFWASYSDIAQRQESNPVNIIIKKSFFKGLYADVVDNGANAISTTKVNRHFWERKGNLKFLERAEHQANMINKSNEAMNTIPYGTIS